MRLASIVLVFIATVLGPQPAIASDPCTWTMDPSRSRVGFSVTKFGFADVHGVFEDFDAAICYDPARPAATTIRWRVRAASVRTDDGGRDRSLQSAEYFDTARHPELSFASDTVRPLPDGRLEAAGHITIKGQRRPLTVVLQPRAAGDGGGFETRFDLDRFDFNIVGGSVMRRIVGRTVRVHLIAVTVRP